VAAFQEPMPSVHSQALGMASSSAVHRSSSGDEVFTLAILMDPAMRCNT
jgi:hypothetical protein